MKISMVVATHKEKVRSNNEDNFYFPQSIIKHGLDSYTYESGNTGSLSDFIVKVNESVCDKMGNLSNKIGSTAVVVIENDFYELANVGDSRGYLLRDNKLMQISVDHT